MWRASKCAQDLPQQVTIDGVKSLCKVDECNKKVTMLFPILFLKKSCNENHISGGPRATKATLTFRNQCVNDICQKTDQHYTGKLLPATERREMPRLLPQQALSLFFL